MSNLSRYKALKLKGDAQQQRISEHQQLRKKKRGSFLDCQRLSSTNNDIDGLTEDICMLDVTENEVRAKNKWIDLLWSDKLRENMMAVRKLLRKEQQVDFGVMPRLFDLLFKTQAANYNDHYLLPSLKSTISEILVKVSMNFVGDRISTEMIAQLVELLCSELDMSLQNNIVLFIGNIACESSALRDQFIEKGVVTSLRNVIESATHLVLLCNATWALCNICFGQQPPDFSECSRCISTLATLIPHESSEVTINCCHTLAYFTHSSKAHIATIIETGVCPRLGKLLDDSNREVTLAALFITRRLVCGTNEETQHLVKCGILTALSNLLSSIDELILTETCDIIANIAAGNSAEIQAVIDCGAIQKLLSLVQSDDQEVKLAAAFAIRQCLSAERTKPCQVEFLVSKGCIEILSQQLSSVNDTDIFKVLLRALATIFDHFSEIDQQKSYKFDLLSKFRCKYLSLIE